MTSLTEIAQEVVGAVDDSLGFAIVDLNTGLLMGASHRANYLTEEVIDAVAAAAVDLFRGRSISRVEELLADLRHVPNERLWEEVQVTSKKTFHFMLVLPEHRDVLIVLITGKRANLGLGWSAVRRVVPQIESQLSSAGV